MVGFDIDMGNWLFEYLNDNGRNYKVTWSQMSFDTIISAIQADQVDLGISGFTYDEDRKVLFSDPYFESAEVVLVNADSTITSVADLSGKKVGAQLGTTGEECANDIEGAEVQALEDMGVAMASLKANSLDAVIMDEPVAQQYAATGDYKILDEKLLEEENYVIAKEGNEDLMDDVNEAIAAFNESDYKQELIDKWFVSTDDSAASTAEATGDTQ
jgi:polar amino acid transport system substrate-binding protein